MSVWYKLKHFLTVYSIYKRCLLRWKHLHGMQMTLWRRWPGLQLRKSEQNGFHDNFLISQPNPMKWPSLKSSRRDDSNEWSHHMVWLRNKKVIILKTINFRPYLLWLRREERDRTHRSRKSTMSYSTNPYPAVKNVICQMSQLHQFQSDSRSFKLC